jgi:two-component system sensor histidine kinase AlgZ
MTDSAASGFFAKTRLAYAATILGGWTLMAFLWTPPSMLVAMSEHSSASFHAVFLRVFLAFVPWMLATPTLLRASGRFPVEEGRIINRLALHTAIGIFTIPVMAIAGTLLVTLFYVPPGITTVQELGGSIITALYAVPTYIAVVAIGQTLAYLSRYRLRERVLARTQLQALQAQLNPHFLFNALNAISALGYRDPEHADRALTELSALLRLALSEGPAEIALKDEIAFLQANVDLYALLIPDGLDFTMDIAPDAWTARVPRMVLQPLAENAIVHGLARRKGGGRLALTAETGAGVLTLTLSNDAADTPRNNESTGIGLANVRERLRVLYGEEASITLTADGAGCAQARVTLPLRGIESAE